MLNTENIQNIVNQLITDILNDYNGSYNLKASGAFGEQLRAEYTSNEIRVVSTDYSIFLSKGRGSGKRPPVSALIEWVIQKGIASDFATANSIAYAIGTKIAKEGTSVFRRGGIDIFSKHLQSNSEFMQRLSKELSEQVINNLNLKSN